jgi:hypothetical protein
MEFPKSKTPKLPFAELIGTGIFKGLNVWRNLDNNITISAGFGISSNEHRIGLNSTNTYYYAQEISNLELLSTANLTLESEIVNYFQQKMGAGNPFKIWQLLKDACTSEHILFDYTNPLKIQFSGGDDDFLDDKVVLLFAQNAEDEPRLLLLTKEAVCKMVLPASFPLANIAPSVEDSSLPFSIFDDANTASNVLIKTNRVDIYNQLHLSQKLPVLKRKRFGYGDIGISNMPCDVVYKPAFCDATLWKKEFKSITKEYTTTIDLAFIHLKEAINYFCEQSKTTIDDNTLSYLKQQLEALYTRWCSYNKEHAAIQYWYALMGDLIDAYNELRETTLKYRIASEKTTLEAASDFPQHLLLGDVPAEQGFVYPNIFRTAMHQPPVFNKDNEQLQRIRFNLWRMVMMMKSFYAPTYDWDDTATDSYLRPSTDKNEDNTKDIKSKINMPIRLTPSAPLGMPLGQRAIPYYYDLARSEQSLHWYWDYDATQQNRAEHHLSYHAKNDIPVVKRRRNEGYAGTDGTSYTHVESIIHAFAFDLKGLPFIRIEGHIGKVRSRITSPSDDFYYAVKTYNEKGEEETTGVGIISEIKSRMCQYNLNFEVELINVTDIDFCKYRGVEHLGGVYQGEKLIIIHDDTKIIGDFTYQKKEDICVPVPVTTLFTAKSNQLIEDKTIIAKEVKKSILIKGQKDSE